LDGAIQDRFGKRYVASGGTATLDEAIKKKYAKKEMLLKANNDTIVEGHKIATEWAKTQNLQLVEV
jgi:pyruvate ferredoxin oxidoreductase gamma subunit